MNQKHIWILLPLITLACVSVGPRFAAGEELDDATKARIAKAEAGAQTVDVSHYPKEIQENYQIFSEKCTQCHKLSRPINSDYALPSEWERYVKRMMHKPGSGIDSDSGKKIYEFLVYDSSIRKKSLVDAKLEKASPDERKSDEDKIKEIHQKYDSK